MSKTIDNRNKEIDVTQEDLDELDALAAVAPDPDNPATTPDDDSDQDPNLDDDQTPDDDPETPPTPEIPPVPPTNPEPPVISEKPKAAVESTREAMVQASKNKKLIQTIDEAASITEVSDDDMRIEMSKRGMAFDDMSDGEKALWRENVLNSRRLGKIVDVANESKKLDEWADKVDSFISDSTNLTNFPVLGGRENEFRTFCMKPTRRGVDLEDLVASFGYNIPAIPKKPGSMLISGSGVTPAPVKTKGNKVEDLATLRKKDSKEYMRRLKAGEFPEDIDDF